MKQYLWAIALLAALAFCPPVYAEDTATFDARLIRFRERTITIAQRITLVQKAALIAKGFVESDDARDRSHGKIYGTLAYRSFEVGELKAETIKALVGHRVTLTIRTIPQTKLLWVARASTR